MKANIWLLHFIIFRKKSAIYKFDHVYPGSDDSDVPVVAVLYGELGKPKFRDFHVELRNLAMSHEVTYLLRHFVKVGIYWQFLLSSLFMSLYSIKNACLVRYNEILVISKFQVHMKDPEPFFKYEH